MNDNRPTIAMLIIGTIVFVAVLACWLLAEFNHIGTGALLAFAVPVVSALFLANNLTRTASAAQQAASQTNGMLDARVKAAVTAALSDRDAARTWQAQQAQTVPATSVSVAPDPEPSDVED